MAKENLQIIFLQKFDEATFVINNPLIHGEQRIEIKILGFICDVIFNI